MARLAGLLSSHRQCVGQTSISTLESGVLFRGYQLVDLVEDASFPEVAFLLMQGRLPNLEDLADFHAILTDESQMDSGIIRALDELPIHVPILDVIRSGIDLISHHDPQVGQTHPEAMIAQAMRLLAQFPRLLSLRSENTVRQQETTDFDNESYASALLSAVSINAPTPLAEHALECLLIITAASSNESSVLAARLCSSSGGDLYSGLLSAYCCYQGQAHFQSWEDLADFCGNYQPLIYQRSTLLSRIEKAESLPGFQFRSHHEVDNREKILRQLCHQLAQETNQGEVELFVKDFEHLIWQQTKMTPTLDWTIYRLMTYLGIKPHLTTAVLALGHLINWTAHIMEQATTENTFQPMIEYCGPLSMTYESLDARS